MKQAIIVMLFAILSRCDGFYGEQYTPAVGDYVTIKTGASDFAKDYCGYMGRNIDGANGTISYYLGNSDYQIIGTYKGDDFGIIIPLLYFEPCK